MLTVDFDRLGLKPGERVLDMGCGAGRHAFEMYNLGADVIAFDQNADELHDVAEFFAAMRDSGDLPPGAEADVKQGDALSLPFGDGEFDRIVCAEVLEHIPSDDQAISELARVLKPGGTIAVTVPRWGPEKVCWALSEAYHSNEGGHVRIYRGHELIAKLASHGLVHEETTHTHGLHAPYWWLKCAVGVSRDDHPLVRGYHQILVWDIVQKRGVSRATRLAERLLSPVIGKSMVLYLHKPATAAAASQPSSVAARASIDASPAQAQAQAQAQAT